MRTKNKHDSEGVSQLKTLWRIGEIVAVEEDSTEALNPPSVSIYDTPTGGAIPRRKRKRSS